MEFETKLDQVVAYLQGVKDLPTLKNILTALNLKPPATLDMTDRRAVVRALTNYLNDEGYAQNPRMDQKLDRVIQIQIEYFERRKREQVSIKREVNNPGGERVRDGGERGDALPAGAAAEGDLIGAVAAPPHHQYDPSFDLLGQAEGGQLVDLLGDNPPPVLQDVRNNVAVGTPQNAQQQQQQQPPPVPVHAVGVNAVPAVVLDAPNPVEMPAQQNDALAVHQVNHPPHRPVPPRRRNIPVPQQNVVPQDQLLIEVDALPDVPGVVGGVGVHAGGIRAQNVPVVNPVLANPYLQQQDHQMFQPDQYPGYRPYAAPPSPAVPAAAYVPAAAPVQVAAPVPVAAPVLANPYLQWDHHQPAHQPVYQPYAAPPSPAVPAAAYVPAAAPVHVANPVPVAAVPANPFLYGQPPAQQPGYHVPVATPVPAQVAVPGGPAYVPGGPAYVPGGPAYVPGGPAYGYAPQVPAPVYNPVALPRFPVAAAAPAGYRHQAPAGYRLRECKLNGKIVSPGEKDGISYGSLMYQIEAAQRQGYPDVDICAAIIKATTAKSLRGVLEARPGASIAEITPALKAHFTVKGVKSVFHELGKAKQGSGESALEFCMNMIGLRELVIRMNREEGAPLTPQLIQMQFQESLSTGLRGNNMRLVLRGMLRVPNVDDNVLIKEITDLMLNEKEHGEKTEGGSEPAAATVNSVAVDQNRTRKDKNNPLLAEITKISADIKHLGVIQPQLDDLKKELKMQQRVFRMLSLTPEQKQFLASEHPQMLPLEDSPDWPPTAGSNLNPGSQGYDPVNAMYRGSWGRYPQRGGYQGAAGRGRFVSRGGYRGSQVRGGYRGHQIGAHNQSGGNLHGTPTSNPVPAGQNNINNGNNNNVQSNNNNNVPSNNNNVNSNSPGYTAVSSSFSAGTQSLPVSQRGNYGGGRGRGSHRGEPYVFSASYNVGCASCWAIGAPCPHCFQCGYSGHSAATCPLN